MNETHALACGYSANSSSNIAASFYRKKKQYIDLIGLLYQIKTTVYWLTFKKLLLLFLLLTNDGIVSIASKSTPDSISCFILGLCHSLITYK